MRLSGCPSALPLAACAAAALGAVCAGGTITPISQQRTISTQVDTAACPAGADSQSDAAAGFNAFNQELHGQQQCSAAESLAWASQQSQIGASSMSAQGSCQSKASANAANLIVATGNSHFEVTFHLAAPGTFTLSGELKV